MDTFTRTDVLDCLVRMYRGSFALEGIIPIYDPVSGRLKARAETPASQLRRYHASKAELLDAFPQVIEHRDWPAIARQEHALGRALALLSGDLSYYDLDIPAPLTVSYYCDHGTRLDSTEAFAELTCPARQFAHSAFCYAHLLQEEGEGVRFVVSGADILSASFLPPPKNDHTAAQVSLLHAAERYAASRGQGYAVQSLDFRGALQPLTILTGASLRRYIASIAFGDFPTAIVVHDDLFMPLSDQESTTLGNKIPDVPYQYLDSGFFGPLDDVGAVCANMIGKPYSAVKIMSMLLQRGR